MNILFLETNISPSLGGVERATWSISKWLEQRGHTCYYGCYQETGEGFVAATQIFKYSLSWDVQAFVTHAMSFIQEKKIDVVIDQCIVSWAVWALFRKLEKKGVRRIFCYHLLPEMITKGESSLKAGFLRAICRHFPYSHHVQRLRSAYINELGLGYLYRLIYHAADDFVILSESFRMPMTERLGLRESSKFSAIPNPLSYKDGITKEELSEKRPVVLIVARMDDQQKNITGALRIWKEIEQSPSLSEWQLYLAGDGPDKEMLLQYSVKLGLNRVRFLGHCADPRPYYKEASLFMMTSHFEGFGITLIEALQMGCVPAAFDTFSSLHDIITDGQNGVIIQAGDEAGFVRRLSSLMEEGRQIRQMSAVTASSVMRYDISQVGKTWELLLQSRQQA